MRHPFPISILHGSLTESQSELRLIPYDQAYAKGFEDMYRRVPSVEKINQLIGWRPTKSLDEILRLTADYERALLTANR